MHGNDYADMHQEVTAGPLRIISISIQKI